MFIPPFCPNPRCKHHREPRHLDWWRCRGFHPTLAFGPVPRFQCRSCGKTFSTQTFRLDYYAKKVVDYRALALLHMNSLSLRGASRCRRLSTGTVQNRLDRLARQALALHAELSPLAAPDEPVCIDGFVSFDVSQYFPSEISIAVTSATQFFLDLSHATHRRSGTMTEAQKKRSEELYAGFTFEQGGVRRTFREMLDSLARERPPRPGRPLVIVTDEKPDYVEILRGHPLSLNQDEEHQVRHIRVSSEAPRTYWNPLFASNYLDREIRKDQANHRRETTCFSRNVANGMSRLALYLISHNCLKKFRIKAKVEDERVHAEAAGLEGKALRARVGEMFRMRSFLSRTRLPPTLKRIWRKDFVTPLLERQARLPAYALG